MRSNHLVRFYDEHCSRAIAKISGCDKTLMELQAKLTDMYAQVKFAQQDLNLLWKEIYGKAVFQRDVYAMKRKEALIVSRYNDLQFQVNETRESIRTLIDNRENLLRLRLHYEKKKKKWEWMSECARKKRIRNQIYKDEQAAEECVAWVTL
ncbi:hypothetical protein V2E67_001903 [Citrobacter freundii]|nr:hypothetical protein [Citrobacter freundii]